MIHNIVVDNAGNEHQAVKSDSSWCRGCSLAILNCTAISSPCTSDARKDEEDAIYKRRIKIGDLKR